MTKFITLLLILITISACSSKRDEEIMLYYKSQRYHVTCVDSNGKEYYNRIGYDVWRDGGNITLYVSEDGRVKDIVLGNCVASQFDIRDKKE